MAKEKPEEKEKPKEEREFQDYLVEREKELSFDINGKKYPLKIYTVRLEMKIKGLFDDPEQWLKKLEELDGETICKTAFPLMKDTEDFKTWEELADIMSADFLDKVLYYGTIISAISKSMPEIKERIDDSIKKLRAQVREHMEKMNQ